MALLSGHTAATSIAGSALFLKFLRHAPHSLVVLVRHSLLVNRLGHIIEGHNLCADTTRRGERNRDL